MTVSCEKGEAGCVEVTASVLSALRHAAESALPEECCGIMLGDGVRIVDIVPAANIAADPMREFEIDPVALIAAHRVERGGGPRVLGYYHSHPVGEAVPSAVDCRNSTGDSRIWAIIARGDVAFWRDCGNGFAPLTFAVTEIDCDDAGRIAKT